MGVANGQFVAAMTSLTYDNGNHPASEFTPESINSSSKLFSDLLTGLFQAWVGNRTPVSITLTPGQIVIAYAR